MGGDIHLKVTNVLFRLVGGWICPQSLMFRGMDGNVSVTSLDKWMNMSQSHNFSLVVGYLLVMSWDGWMDICQLQNEQCQNNHKRQEKWMFARFLWMYVASKRGLLCKFRKYMAVSSVFNSPFLLISE